MGNEALTAREFIAKWRASTLKERSAAQEHFIDLCRLVEHPTPAEADPTGAHFTFERGATKTGGGEGWADVWKKGCFAWEYKGKHKDLTAAFSQLQRYAIALENPPLLVVSDMETIVIHTNFTNTVQEIHTLALEELERPEAVRKLRWLLTEPERFRPGVTRSMVTEQAAQAFASLAQGLRDTGFEGHRVAHFVNKLIFCMFAEDSGILPGQLFTRMVESVRTRPEKFAEKATLLFAAMRDGGEIGFGDVVPWFNGGLFDDADALPLDGAGVAQLLACARLDWSEIEPAIFGTLFERGLDPAKRSQLGAHYTDRESIMRIVGPVVVEPLEREWAEVKSALAMAPGPSPGGRGGKKTEARYREFLAKLRAVRVLDPACGSGNFLYLALIELKNLEHRVMLEGEAFGFHREFPQVGPHNVLGLEINDYAAELARVTVWIGDIQWSLKNGLGHGAEPILKKLDTIQCRDALMNADGSEAAWPRADCIVGNPPFLGDKKMLSELGEDYVTRLRALYKGRVPGGADLVTYWFEKARAGIEAGRARRTGLVATNSVRGGANREVLKRICAGGRIFNAWSDEPWINEGAAVRVSLVCFEGNPPQPPFVKGGSEGQRPPLPDKRTAKASPTPPHEKVAKASPPLHKGDLGEFFLDGKPVSAIYADLTGPALRAGFEPAPTSDLTAAKKLAENTGVSFIGGMKKGAFDVPGDLARKWLMMPTNPNGKPNSNVITPWKNGLDVTRRPSDKWIVDFGLDLPENEAALFEAPFEYVYEHVKPARDAVRNDLERDRWWLHARPAPDLRRATAKLRRFIATPRVAKYRLFVWLSPPLVCDGQLVVIARDDDTSFGILHSRFHELWALRMCTFLGVGNDPRYTPTTTFETFSFPSGLTPDIPVAEYADHPHAQAIASAARRLVELRDNWLNPAEWVERVPEVVAGYPERVRPKPGCEKELAKRTLTNLYNQRPQWLANAHATLDDAVAAAYGWPADLANDEILARLLALNRERSEERPK